jgi:hypothetical protein
MDHLANQLQQLSIQHIVANQSHNSAVPATKTLEVHSVQSMNPKGKKKPKGKLKAKGKKGKGG